MNFKCAGLSDSFIDGLKGITLNIFFQGCHMGCKNCQNPELQDCNGGFEMDTSVVVEHVKKFEGFYDSVTFVGGEPMEQPEALLDIANNIPLAKVLYTGKSYEELPENIRENFSIIVDGPYVENLATGAFPASSNQTIHYQKA